MKTKKALTEIGRVVVSLTYHLTGEPLAIVFHCKLALDADDKAARQAFYAQPDGDVEAGAFAYHVDMLARIVQAVDGLPGFGDVLDRNVSAPNPIADAIREYFGTAEPILQKIAADAVELYNRNTQPAEFFR